MKPLLTIITVVFNAKDELDLTIKSLRQQSFKDFEYIIVDGASKDGTLTVIEGNKDIISHFVSERDKGLYDAMNKGIDLAKGKYINFLNAGDEFYGPDTLKEVAQILQNADDDLIYGDEVVGLDGQSWARGTLPLQEMWKKMPFCHQAVFIKTDYHKNRKYNLAYRIGADYDFLYDSYVKGKKFKKIDLFVSRVSPGGVSDKKRIESIQERLKIIQQHTITPMMKLYYEYLLIDARLRLSLKEILPASLVKKIILRKYKS